MPVGSANQRMKTSSWSRAGSAKARNYFHRSIINLLSCQNFVWFLFDANCKIASSETKMKVKVKVKLHFSAPSAGIAEIEQT